MSELKIRLVKNGYLITENDYDYSGEDEYIAATDKDMLAHVVDYFSDRDMQWTGGEIVSGEPWPSSQDSVAAPDEGYDEEPVNTEAMDELLKTDGELYPESPQDTDSTETMVESDCVVIAEGGEIEWTEAVADEIDAALNPEPVQTRADLSGDEAKVYGGTGFIKSWDPVTGRYEYHQSNGSLPETE